MNPSHIEHIVVAVLVQIMTAAITGNWWIGAALGAGIFLGREHAQAELRVMASGLKRDDTFIELVCLHPRWWDRDSVLDWLAPLVAVCGLAYLAAGG